MRRIKTNTRSSLSKDNLISLMHIAMQSGEEVNFDPNPAIQVWNSAARRKRRPFQPPYKSSVVPSQGEDEFAEEEETSDKDSERECIITVEDGSSNSVDLI